MTRAAEDGAIATSEVVRSWEGALPGLRAQVLLQRRNEASVRVISPVPRQKNVTVAARTPTSVTVPATLPVPAAGVLSLVDRLTITGELIELQPELGPPEAATLTAPGATKPAPDVGLSVDPADWLRLPVTGTIAAVATILKTRLDDRPFLRTVLEERLVRALLTAAGDSIVAAVLGDDAIPTVSGDIFDAMAAVADRGWTPTSAVASPRDFWAMVAANPAAERDEENGTYDYAGIRIAVSPACPVGTVVAGDFSGVLAVERAGEGARAGEEALPQATISLSLDHNGYFQANLAMIRCETTFAVVVQSPTRLAKVTLSGEGRTRARKAS